MPYKVSNRSSTGTGTCTGTSQVGDIKSILHVKSSYSGDHRRTAAGESLTSSSASLETFIDLSSSSRQSSSSSGSSSVSFDRVQIREYEITLGDNPSCSSGPPISLGWHYYENEQREVPVESYEEGRDGKRRDSDQMKIPADIRYETLRNLRIPAGDISKAELTCAEIKKQRQQTYQKEYRKEVIKNFKQRLTCGMH